MFKKIAIRLSILLSLFFIYQLFYLFSLNYNEGKLKKISADGNYFRSNMFYCKKIIFEEKQSRNVNYLEIKIQNKNFFHNETFYLLNKHDGKKPHNLFKENDDVLIRYRILLFFVYELDYKIVLNFSRKDDLIQYQYKIIN